MQIIFEPTNKNPNIDNYAEEAKKLLATNKPEIVVNDKELLIQISNLCAAEPSQHQNVQFSLKRGGSLITFSSSLALIASLYTSTTKC